MGEIPTPGRGIVGKNQSSQNICMKLAKNGVLVTNENMGLGLCMLAHERLM